MWRSPSVTSVLVTLSAMPPALLNSSILNIAQKRLADWHELGNLTSQLSRKFIGFCLHKIVDLAETVVVQGGYDFMRVDVLIQGYCKSLFVNELSFFPTQPFATGHLDNLAALWRHGYGYSSWSGTRYS